MRRWVALVLVALALATHAGAQSPATKPARAGKPRPAATRATHPHRPPATRPQAKPAPPVPSRVEGPDAAPVRAIEGEPYVAVNDLARLMDATKFWRSDTRRLVLRSGRHSLVLIVDNPFVLL